jgi:hypothetical protein
MGKLYDTDIVAWAEQQAALLRAGKLEELDLDNIAEEIEAVGKSEKRELTHRMAVLTAHLLKWWLQPHRHTQGWLGTIRNQRLRIERLLKKTPSLRPMLDDPEFLDDVWADAQVIVHKEARRVTVPSSPVWPIYQILDSNFLPPA